MAHTLALTLGALALSAALPALAARPFVTEDAGVLERGQCEFEASFGQIKQRGAGKQRRWLLQPVCGLGWRSQLAIGTGAQSGDGLRIQSLSVLGKTWLLPPSDTGPNLALSYAGGMSKISGDRWRHDAKLVNLAATQRLGASTVGLNVGWLRDVIGRQSSTVWALGWEHPVADGLDIGVDLFGDDREAASGNLGVRWTVSDGVWLDAAYARQFNAARAQSLNLGLRLGW